MMSRTPKCWCGGYSVAECTQCNEPLCQKHAQKDFPGWEYGNNDWSKLLSFYEVKEPVVAGVPFAVTAMMASMTTRYYGDRYVCIDCHKKNVRRVLTRFKKTVPWPDGLLASILFVAIVMNQRNSFLTPSIIAHTICYPLDETTTAEAIAAEWPKLAERYAIPCNDVITESEVVIATKKFLGIPYDSTRKVSRQIPVWQMGNIGWYDREYDPESLGGSAPAKGYVTQQGRIGFAPGHHPHVDPRALMDAIINWVSPSYQVTWHFSIEALFKDRD